VSKTEIIVEVGNTHEGSLGVAKSFALMAKKAGAKTVKFQMHIAEFEGVVDEPFRVNFSDQDKTRQDYWKRVNFSLNNWIILADYCKTIEIEFLCTPFSVAAAKHLYENDLVKRWKIGSGQAVEWPLIDYVSATGLPLLISTGLISPSEISILKHRLEENGAWERTTLLHCVSQYPAPLEHLDLHLMNDLRSLGCQVGYSDHSGDINVAKYAIALGADCLEIHMTPRKDFFGPDVTSSLLPEEISELLRFSEICELLRKSTGNKMDHFERVKDLRKIFRKGVYWSSDLTKGTIVSKEHLKFLKPVMFVDVVDYEELIGQKLLVDVFIDNPVRPEDISNRES
jgi:N-acetylneuraminate synthase